MEARKLGISVSREAINKSFRPALNSQVSKYPLYGLSQGLTPRIWWQDVRAAVTFDIVCPLPKH
jgi:hypothetical protein